MVYNCFKERLYDNISTTCTAAFLYPVENYEVLQRAKLAVRSSRGESMRGVGTFAI